MRGFIILAAAFFLVPLLSQAQQLSNAQTIATTGGRIVGAARECGLDDTQVSRAGAKVLIVSKSRVKPGERGGSPDTLFSIAYDQGRNEVATGRTGCATVRESFRDLNMQLSMH